ncbi:MAG TPA: septal ring lytic transglycosylase RlpA family protein [Burkholderiales bacterium]|nr:septal ring lytic transglycosylase RlpA family protein [Burkholderiales bacterium]
MGKRAIALCAIAAVIAGCTSAPTPPRIEREAKATTTAPAPAPARRGGGYYMDDGPGDGTPPDLGRVADAEPRPEALHRFANSPYVVFGRQYVPDRELRPVKQRGLGSWYGRKFHGQRTASGEIYDMYAMTAAHPTLPIPSYARVSNVANGRSVVVRVNDRGPFLHDRIIDLSYAAAWKLGYVEQGAALVEVEAILPDRTLVAAAPSQWPERAAPATRAPEAQPAEAVRVPVEAGPGGVYLQLGAFSDRDNAENFRARLALEFAALDRPAEIYRRDGLFRLHVGPYRTRAEASAAADRLKDALDVKPHVVVR